MIEGVRELEIQKEVKNSQIALKETNGNGGRM